MMQVRSSLLSSAGVPVDSRILMSYNPLKDTHDLGVDSEEHRKCGRLTVEGIVCSLGVLTNLSATGMRVVGRRFGEGPFTVDLCGDDVELQVSCRLVWKQRLGFRKYEAGFEFVDMDDEMREKLTKLVLITRNRRIM